MFESKGIIKVVCKKIICSLLFIFRYLYCKNIVRFIFIDKDINRKVFLVFFFVIEKKWGDWNEIFY